MAFRGFKGMDLFEQVHIFDLSNLHTYGSNISLIKLFSLIFNYAKPRLLVPRLKIVSSVQVQIQGALQNISLTFHKMNRG